jgi:hypothetical protein
MFTTKLARQALARKALRIAFALAWLSISRTTLGQCGTCLSPSFQSAPRVYSIRPEGLSSAYSDSANAVAIADFNRDGIPDISVATDFKLVILFGTGAGQFGPPTFLDGLPYGGGSSLAIGDFDGDGNPDIVLNGNAVFLGDGAGGFQPPISTGTASSFSVVAADFDGDGVLDLALTGPQDRITILHGLGDGHFEVLGTVHAGPQPSHLAAADLDGDGLSDLLVGDEGDGNVYVLRGQANALPVLVGATHVGDKVVALAAADLDGDGHPDAVAGVYNQYGDTIRAVAVLRGNGDGTFATPAVYASPALPAGIVLADFTADGRLDVAISGIDGLVMFPNDGSGGLLAPQLRQTGDDGIGVAAADFDGDGRPDLVVAGGYDDDIFVFLTRPDGTPSEMPFLASGSIARSLHVLDMDGNGAPDVVISNWESRDIWIFPGNGDGTFGNPHVATNPNPYGGAVLGDLNGDGLPDVIASSAGFEQLYVSLNLGGDNLGAPTELLSLRGVEPLALVDLNGDSLLDIVAVSDSTALVHFGQGGGAFGPPVPIPGTDSGTILNVGAVGDLNRDGKPDLVVEAIDTGVVKVLVLLGQGDGTFSAPISYDVPASGQAILIADADGDGKPDVLVGGYSPNGFYLLRGDGSGGLGAPVFFPGLYEPTDLKVADINGDGLADVIAALGQVAGVSIWPGVSGGTFGPPTHLAAPFAPQYLGTGDLDGDGKIDLLAVGSWSYYDTDRLAVLRNSRCEPSRLALGTVPDFCVHPGAPFASQPSLRLVDDGGNTACGGGAVQAAIMAGTGTPGASLGGQTTAALVQGVATFTDLSIDTAGSGYILGYTHLLASTRGGAFDVADDPPTPSASSSGTFCQGESIRLYASAVPGASYRWVGPNGFSSHVQSPTIPSATLEAAGTYSVTATVNGCTSAPATTSVAASAPLPGPDLGGTTQVCTGSRLLLTASGGAPGYLWYHDGAPIAGADLSTYTVAAAAASDAGAYTAVSVNAQGCTSGPSSPITVSVLGGCNVFALGLTVDPAATTLSNGNGILEPGETVIVVPRWRNSTSGFLPMTSAASNLRGPGPATYLIPDSIADYGTLPPETAKDCLEATGNCFAVSVSAASRPAVHWDALLDESPSTGDPTRSWILHVGASFNDVDPMSPFYDAIERTLHQGVTSGCGGGAYCPGSSTSRAQMAVFLVRAMHGPSYEPSPATGTLFLDVTPRTFAADWIEDLYRAGITAGCGAERFCPSAVVPREQMAVFLLRAIQPFGYIPPPATGIFADVPVSDPFARWIEALYHAGITAGCAGGPPPSPIYFCPNAAVTRGQMAALMNHAFHFSLYQP